MRSHNLIGNTHKYILKIHDDPIELFLFINVFFYKKDKCFKKKRYCGLSKKNMILSHVRGFHERGYSIRL